MNEEFELFRCLLARIEGALEATRGMAAAVIDARQDPMRAVGLFPRPWAANGFRHGLLAPKGVPPYVISDLREQKVPVFCLYVDGRGPDQYSEELRVVMGELETIMVLQSDDGGFIMGDTGRPLREEGQVPLGHMERTHVVLHGRNKHWRRAVDLPLEQEVQLVGNDPRKWVVGVEITCEDAAEHCRTEWYRLDGPERGNLTIDMTATASGDSLHVTYAGSSANLARVNQPGLAEPDEGLPNRLAVILDRTCPDTEAWPMAYDLAIGKGTSAGSGDFWQKPGGGSLVWGDDTQGKLHPNDFNRAIREALGDALAGALHGQDVQVDAWWFADMPGDGMDTPQGAVMPPKTHGMVPTGQGMALREAFSACHYSPGLDLFDPLQTALNAALDQIEENHNGTAALLIVGNSPPNVPSDTENPIFHLPSALGHHTTFRGGVDPWWQAALERAEELNVRLLYLFLSHARVSITEELSQAYIRSTDLQEKVRVALAACLPLEAAEATREGVADGVRRALEKLRAPRQWTSRVEVIR